MKFFNRCRLLCKILIVLCILIGIALGVSLFSILGDISLVDSSTNRSLFLFASVGCFWLLLILIVIILNCIIKDAEEDFKAIMEIKKQLK